MITAYTIWTHYPVDFPDKTKGEIFDTITRYCCDDILHFDVPTSVRNVAISIKTGKQIDLEGLANKLDDEFGDTVAEGKVVLGFSSYFIRELSDGPMQ